MSVNMDRPAEPPGKDALDFAEALAPNIDAAVGWLVSEQKGDGHWCAELEGDTILESEYVLLMAYLGRHRTRDCTEACKYMLTRQNDEGGWAIYPGGPSELSATVKAYYALKLTGLSTDDPRMVKARNWILSRGGAMRCNSFTRFYLALLGQIPYSDTPSVPPELLYFPKKLPFSIYAMSSWTRDMVVTLSIMSALKPCRKLAGAEGIEELFVPGVVSTPDLGPRGLTWKRFFFAADRGLKLYEKYAPKFLRNRSVKAAERWMLEHLENSDGLGAIFPPMVYTIIALKALGYADDSSLQRWAMDKLDELLIREHGMVRIQPCFSPVWDTAIAALAVSDGGLPGEDSSLHKASRWLLDKEIRVKGDWAVRGPDVEPSGWHFQYANQFNADIDDTAMVLLALKRGPETLSEETNAATRRAVAWLLGMQNRDGGWAAFDIDIDNEVLTAVPFADHNAMLDPSCVDITLRIVELLGVLGFDRSHPSIVKALDYLWKTQEPEGCWFGRWGVNYVYGTWQALQGLQAIDFPMDDARVRKAVEWLKAVQQPCGGWGETCASYDDPSLKGKGTPTASQTAWALLGLIAAGDARSEAVRRGIEWLKERQTPEGDWPEADYTGTGFPKVFYLKYHYYRVSFPLMALARYRATIAGHAPSRRHATQRGKAPNLTHA
jgi:squalene-hopene/tetraprenyl-beta-curcumene cyclase